MWKKLLYVFSLVLVPFLSRAEGYPEVLFDNSILDGSYAKSTVNYTGESWVQNVNHKLPLSDSLFFTPGNALSLRYVSSPLGSWQVDILNDPQKLRYNVSNRDVLTLRLYVQSNTKKEELPKIALRQGEITTSALRLSDFISDYSTDTWLTIAIPVSKFGGIAIGKGIASLLLLQHASSGATHQLFVDQIEFLPVNYPKAKLSSPAILSKISAVDKQVELIWQLPLTPSIRYIKIYRSEDKVNFQPISIVPIYVQKSLDRVPDYGKTYYYKITWVDYNYGESPFSAIQEIAAKRATDEELISFIRNTHVNYFVDNYDINSGMFLPDKGNSKAIVSTNETGYAILGLLVGAEQKLISKQALLGRLGQMVKFLGGAQHYQGVLTAFYDGRNGIPFYPDSIPTYDLRATASIMEALLVAREYFSGNNAEENKFRENVNALWARINWRIFTKPDNADVLISKWSPIDSTARAQALGGFNESLTTYILAISSPTHPLASTAYENGYATNHFTDIDEQISDSLFFDTPLVNKKLNDSLLSPVSHNPLLDSTAAHSTSIYSNDKVVYGKKISAGDLSHSLMPVYRPFLLLNPRGKSDSYIDYYQYLSDFILAYKRRDNELNLATRFTDIWGVEQSGEAKQEYLINPAISVSAYTFEKEIGTKAIKRLYAEYADILFTQYGFRSWLDIKNGDASETYRARNQATIAVALENAQTGLIWKLYGQIPEIKKTLETLYPAK